MLSSSSATSCSSPPIKSMVSLTQQQQQRHSPSVYCYYIPLALVVTCTIALLSFAGELHLFVVASATCECGFGSVVKTLPYCSCECTTGSGFAPPQCHYKTNSKQQISFSLDASVATVFTDPLQFSSDMLTLRLQTFLGLNDTQYERDIVLRKVVVKTDVQIATETEAEGNQFKVQVMIASEHIPAILNGFYSSLLDQPTWVAGVGAIAIVVFEPLLPEESYIGIAASSGYTFGTIYNAPVSLSTIGWLLSAFVLTIFLYISDCVMMTSSEEERGKAKGRHTNADNSNRNHRRRGGSGGGGHLRENSHENDDSNNSEEEEKDELYMKDAELDAYRARKEQAKKQHEERHRRLKPADEAEAARTRTGETAADGGVVHEEEAVSAEAVIVDAGGGENHSLPSSTPLPSSSPNRRFLGPNNNTNNHNNNNNVVDEEEELVEVNNGGYEQDTPTTTTLATTTAAGVKATPTNNNSKVIVDVDAAVVAVGNPIPNLSSSSACPLGGGSTPIVVVTPEAEVSQGVQEGRNMGGDDRLRPTRLILTSSSSDDDVEEKRRGGTNDCSLMRGGEEEGRRGPSLLFSPPADVSPNSALAHPFHVAS